MAGKVFFSVTMSLDGFMAPEAVPVEDVFSPEGQNDPRVQRWMTKWSELQAWLFPQRWFRENLKLGEGGEEGLDNDIARATHERTGASVMGKRMFDAGELAWPEEAPFHTPVFVVTHTKRDPWERPGGTTFHFVNDGISSALDQAREAAGDRDVRIAGGAETIQRKAPSRPASPERQAALWPGQACCTRKSTSTKAARNTPGSRSIPPRAISRRPC
jgi:dihydrofolate reductase